MATSAAVRRAFARCRLRLIPGIAGVLAAVQACVIPLDYGTPAPESSNTGGSSTSSVSSSSSSSTNAIPGSWTNETLNLAGLPTSCGNIAMLSAKPDEDLLITSVVGMGLFARQNGQTTWQPLGGAIPQATEGANSGRPTAIVYDPMHSTTFWISMIYSPGPAMLTTTNDGLSFQSFGGTAITDSQAFSVDFTDPSRKTILAGAHEQDQQLNLSQDSGMTWTNLEAGLPQGTDCGWPLIVNSTTFLTGCDGFSSSSMGVIGVYRSTDTGKTWTLASAAGQGGASTPLVASDGSIYWASPDGTLVRSTDQGATWKPTSSTSNHLYAITPVELPDGRLASVGPAQSSSPTVVVSADHGATWAPASPPLSNVDTPGLVYSKQQKKFYTWNPVCQVDGGSVTSVPDASIESFPFDDSKT